MSASVPSTTCGQQYQHLPSAHFQLQPEKHKMAGKKWMTRIAPQWLAEQILANKHHAIKIVDVRDDDFAGGNIIGVTNIPKFDKQKAQELLQQCKHVELLLFHCFFCQFRGPAAAKVMHQVAQEAHVKLNM